MINTCYKSKLLAKKNWAILIKKRLFSILAVLAGGVNLGDVVRVKWLFQGPNQIFIRKEYLLANKQEKLLVKRHLKFKSKI